MLGILVVDDEPDRLSDLKRAAEGRDHSVSTATNPGDALALIAAREFDLVVTDLVMGDDEEAGFQVLRASRKRDEDVPVIVITAQPSPTLTRKALDLGALDFVDRTNRSVDVYRLLKHKIKIALKYRQKLGAVHAAVE